MKRYADVISSSVLVVISIVMLNETRRIQALGIMEFGPKVMPRLMAGALLIVGAGILIPALLRLRRPVAAAVSAAPPATDYRRVALTAALITLYVFSLRPLGFLLTTVLYLFGQFLVLGGVVRRRLPMYGFLALAVAFGIYYLFYGAFKVLLPPGRIW
jgi:putative tricarboxylic transport membrane protein